MSKTSAKLADSVLDVTPLSIRLTEDIERGLKSLRKMRGDGVTRSALVREILMRGIREDLARYGANSTIYDNSAKRR